MRFWQEYVMDTRFEYWGSAELLYLWVLRGNSSKVDNPRFPLLPQLPLHRRRRRRYPRRYPQIAGDRAPAPSAGGGRGRVRLPPPPPLAAEAPADVLRRRRRRRPLAGGAPAYLWRREEKWHVVTPGDGDSSPRLKIDSDGGRPRRRRRGAGSARLSSGEEEEEGEEEDDDETETPVSSPEKFLRRRRSAAEGRVGESFAVVKRSEDPRGDFRRSMAEMVVEKEIYDAAGLEQLLRCLLSLNDRRHHRAITAAFGDIWDAVFPSPALLR
uniref:Transcription repressor n=1 Tax=Ananas comosus var. bracteatus TaxID=296719 RepID=A0A6V7Q3N7_ANACO|nr:unnamed protein product [Ananas comosus var. bracteatus]